MVSNYTPGNLDVFTGAPQGDTSTTATRSLRDFRNKMGVTDVVGPDGKPIAGVKEVEIVINNLTGGLNRVWGIAREPSPYYPYSDLDRYATSIAILADEAGVLSLGPILTADTLNPLNYYPLTSVNFAGVNVIGNGKTANTCLKRETSTTNPVLVDITYNPTNVITNLCTGIVGGATQAEKLFVHKEGAAIEVLSNVTTAGPTVYGTMNAVTSTSWGHLNSPLNAANPGATTLLIYGNGALFSLDSTSAVGTLPATVLSATPNGGYPIGIIKLPGAPLRAYWFFPSQSLAHSICNLVDNAAVNFGKIVSTQLDGTDPQDVRLPLSRILGACQFGDSIVFWDGLSIWQLTDAPRNLNIFKQRLPFPFSASPPYPVVPNSDVEFQVMGCYVANGDLISMTVENNIVANTGLLMGEKYVPATGAWHRQVPGAFITTSGVAGVYLRGNIATPMATGTYPFSASSGMVVLPSVLNTTIVRHFVPPSGTIPFYAYNQTSGGGNTKTAYYSGTTPPPQIVSAAMILEGLEGYPFILEEVRCLGDIPAGGVSGTPASWKLDIAVETTSGFQWSSNVSTTFSGTDPFYNMVKRKAFDTNTEYATRLQYRLTLAQGSGSTYQTPNGLPFSMKFLVFTDGMPRSPLTVRGASSYG